MEGKLELFDRKRRSCYRSWLTGFIFFTVLWVVRYGLRWRGIRSEVLDWTVGICLALTIPTMFFFLIRMDALRRQARTDPELAVLLQDELIKYHELRAWKFGFIAMAACLALFVVLSIFLELKDTNAVVFTALFAGLGGYHLSFYRMERG